MGERLVCNQEVIGSIPFTSTILCPKSEGGLDKGHSEDFGIFLI